MTDRLTSAMLREIGEIFSRAKGNPRYTSDWGGPFRDEAARREAEQPKVQTGACGDKELGRTPDKMGASASSDYTMGEREGPGSAAALAKVGEDYQRILDDFRKGEKPAFPPEDKPAPAAAWKLDMDLTKPFGKEFVPVPHKRSPADDEWPNDKLTFALRRGENWVWGVPMNVAADRIEALAREIAEYQKDLGDMATTMRQAAERAVVEAAVEVDTKPTLAAHQRLTNALAELERAKGRK